MKNKRRRIRISGFKVISPLREFSIVVPLSRQQAWEG